MSDAFRFLPGKLGRGEIFVLIDNVGGGVGLRYTRIVVWFFVRVSNDLLMFFPWPFRRIWTATCAGL